MRTIEIKVPDRCNPDIKVSVNGKVRRTHDLTRAAVIGLVVAALLFFFAVCKWICVYGRLLP